MTDVVHDLDGAARPVPEQTLFHPIDSDDAGSPDAKLRELRQSCPVSRASREGFPTVTVVTTYDDVAATFRNWRTFGNIGSDPDPTTHDRTPIERRNIIQLDPPVHSWARRLDNLALSPGAVDDALPYVSEVANALVAEFADRDEAELVGEWAEPLPSLAIARVLGLPREDAPIIHGWVSSQFTESASLESGRLYGSAPVVGGEFDQYLQRQIDLRRSDDSSDDALESNGAIRA